MRWWAAVGMCAAISLTAGCGAKAKSDPNAREAAEQVLSLGGSFIPVGTNAAFKKGMNLPEGPITMRAVDLNQRDVTDTQLEKLSGLTNLKKLGLHSAKITAKGFDQLATMTTLEELEVSYTALNDEQLEKLTALPKLQKLFIHGTRVSDEAVQKFQQQKPKVAIVR